ncbi:hypothetical protein ACQP2E_27650 [Actinoplanes sp. CA-015351]|uniref:hypothetical protein n=1 Tax=Actinoplanes sp. CA-015351 TaxID=3239897 RepID=UPI003D9732EE
MVANTAPPQWDTRDPLNWVIPQLRLVRARSAILADSGRAADHARAARDVLGAVRTGARGLLELQPHLPKPVDATKSAVAEAFLMALGDHIDETIKLRGLEWPPPRVDPPPSVTIDLVYLYRCASRQIVPVGGDSRLLLRDKLIKVERQCRILLQQWDSNSRRIAAAKRVAAPATDSAPSRFGAFISGVGLAVSLMQGPGAINDLPEDMQELGGDVVSVSGAVASGLVHLLDQISESVEQFVE